LLQTNSQLLLGYIRRFETGVFFNTKKAITTCWKRQVSWLASCCLPSHPDSGQWFCR